MSVEAAEVARTRPVSSAKDVRSLRQLYYVAVAAALSAVFFAGSFRAQGGADIMQGRAVELAGTLDVNSLELQASQGLPYSQPRHTQLSMIDVVPARMQQLYDTPSVNAAAGGFTNAMLRAAPITDCSGLGCVTRIPVRMKAQRAPLGVNELVYRNHGTVSIRCVCIGVYVGVADVA